MGPVSEHDQAALKQIAPYPQTTALRATVSQVAVYLTNLHNDYERNTAKIDAAQAAETAKLPVCPGEAGVPSSSAVASVRLKYADQRIALCNEPWTRHRPLPEPTRLVANRLCRSWYTRNAPSLVDKDGRPRHGSRDAGVCDGRRRCGARLY